MASRAIVWVKEEPLGAEFADVVIARGRLTAAGIAVGSAPAGYRLDYELETLSDFVTSGLMVNARGEGWSRHLDLRRLRSGRWTARTRSRGKLDLPPPGGDMARLADALDCDLALSPLTNSMPVLRHGLLDGGGPLEFLMAWVCPTWPCTQAASATRSCASTARSRWSATSRPRANLSPRSPSTRTGW
jgi:hypothetical protein